LNGTGSQWSLVGICRCIDVLLLCGEKNLGVGGEIEDRCSISIKEMIAQDGEVEDLCCCSIFSGFGLGEVDCEWWKGVKKLLI
jgi:hypothetical protein